MLYLTNLPPAPRSSARRRFLNKWQVFVFPATVNTAWWVKLAPAGPPLLTVCGEEMLWERNLGVETRTVPLVLLSSCLYWTVDASHSGFACSATQPDCFSHSELSLLVCKCVARFNKVQTTQLTPFTADLPRLISHLKNLAASFTSPFLEMSLPVLVTWLPPDHHTMRFSIHCLGTLQVKVKT